MPQQERKAMSMWCALNLERIPIVGSICKRIDREGEQFFQSGRTLVRFLERFACILKQRKLAELDDLYCGSFQGPDWA